MARESGQSDAEKDVDTRGGACVDRNTQFDQRSQHVERQVNVAGDYYAAPSPIPLQRPPRVEHFTNREEDLARLLADLQPGRVVTLCGPGGIGKTALAAEAAWRLAPGDEPPERFPDGILLYRFHGRPDPALALEHIALSLGVEPRPTPAEAALRALAGKCALLILDGAEEAADLRAVLEPRGACGALVTSRSRQDALTERQDVAPLTADDAVALLRAWGGDYAADDQAGQEICALVGNLPLAVRLAGRYLAETGERATAYLEWLRETPLDALDHGARREESVRVLLDHSLAQVSPAARQVLAVVGMLALAAFDRAPIAVVLDLPPNRLRRPLDELVRYGLLLREGEQYAASHALVHTYARACCSPGEEAAGRLAAYCEALVEEQVQQGREGYRCLEGDRAHVMHVLSACAEAGLWEEVRSLVRTVDSYLYDCGYWTERVQALAAGVRAARALRQRAEEGALLGSLGNAHKDLGQVEEAIEHYQQALAIAREIDDRRNEGSVLGSLGNLYTDLGQVEQALTYHQQALTIAREVGDRRNEGSVLGSLGNACKDLGRVAEAIGYFQQALAVAREIDDRRVEASVLGSLGNAYGDQGRIEEAIDHYSQALAIARQMSDRHVEASALGSLGNAYRSLGQVGEATGYLEQALVMAREIGDRRVEGSVLRDIGNAYADLGQVVEAVGYLELALAIARRIDNQHMEASVWTGLGNVYAALGQVSEAIRYLERAVRIAREIGDRRVEAFACWNLGLLLEENDPARAVELMSALVAYKREVDHPDAKADAERVAQIAARIK